MPYLNVHRIEMINVTPSLIFLVAEILNGYLQDVCFHQVSAHVSAINVYVLKVWFKVNISGKEFGFGRFY